jgi:type IV pilus biogenesis protein CpaD/CtpE
MKRDEARTAATPDEEETRRRLTSEVAEVESAIELVASGAASRITLSGLKFGEQLAQRFNAAAAARGIHLEPLPWPEDAGCDLIVRRIDE